MYTRYRKYSSEYMRMESINSIKWTAIVP